MKTLLISITLLGSVSSFANCYENLSNFSYSMDMNKKEIVQEFMSEKYNVDLQSIVGVEYVEKTKESRLLDYVAYGLDKGLHFINSDNCNPDKPNAGDAGTGEFIVDYFNKEDKVCTMSISVDGVSAYSDFSYDIDLATSNDQIICED